LSKDVKDGQKDSVENKDVQYNDETDLMDDILTAIVQKEGEVDIDALAGKAAEYEKKLEATQTKEKPKQVHHPVVATKPADQNLPKTEKKHGPIKPTGTKVNKGKAAMALRMMAPSKTPADIKPIATPVESKQDAKKPDEGGKSKKSKDKESISAKTPESSEDPWTRPKDTLGDEAFPEPKVPDPSDDYQSLSIISSQYDEITGDLSHVGKQVAELRSMMADTNVRIAKMETIISALQTDKSQFLSSTLDRIRAVERTLGNRPPLATSTKEVTLQETERDGDKTPTEMQSPTTPSLSKEQLLARFRRK